MKLTKIIIRKLPGIFKAFTIDKIDNGINIIYGANGSGKTSICNLIKTSLWNKTNSIRSTDAFLEWNENDDLISTDIFNTVKWHNSKNTILPNIPDVNVSECFHISLAEMFDSKNRTEEEIANKIYTAMTGGCDFRSLREKYSFSRNSLRNEISELELLEKQKRMQEYENKKLSEQQDLIEFLEAEKTDVSNAQDQFKEIEILEEYLRIEKQLKTKQSQISSYPSVLNKFMGNELGLFSKYKKDISELEIKIRETEGKLSDLLKETDKISLPVNIPDQSQIDEIQLKLVKLRADNSTLENLKTELDSSNQKLNTISKDLEKYNISLKENYDYLSPENLKALFSFSEKMNFLSAENNYLKIRIKNLDKEIEKLKSENSYLYKPEEYGYLINLLKKWMNFPVENLTREKRLLFTSLCLCFISGCVSFFQIYLLLVSVFFFGAFTTVLIILLFIKKRSNLNLKNEINKELKKIFNKDKIDYDFVLEKLLEIIQEKADFKIHQDKIVQLFSLKEEYTSGITGNEEEITGLIQRLKNSNILFYKIENFIDAPRLPDLLNIIENYRNEYYRNIELRAKVQDLQKRCKNYADNISNFPGITLPDNYNLDNLEISFKQLNDKIQRKNNLNNEILFCKQRFTELHAALEIQKNKKSGLLENLEFSDDFNTEISLSKYIDLLPEFKQLTTEVQNLSYLLESKSSDRFIKEKYKDKNLQELKLVLRQKSEKYDDIIKQIKEIETRIEIAQNEKKLSECEDKILNIKFDLDNKIKAIIKKLAAGFILQKTENLYEIDNQPEVMKKAIEYFGKFTNFQYCLSINNIEGNPAFTVFDNNNRINLSLTELSDGTRIQLFLAVRLAFIKSIEKNYILLPLFFDETLSVTDAERFREIAETIFKISEESQRQIFYMTSDWNDTLKFGEIADKFYKIPLNIINLSELRKLAEPKEHFSYRQIINKKNVPAPESCNYNPLKYAEELKLPMFNQYGVIYENHLFYIINDDLDILFKILNDLGVNKIGELDYIFKTNNKYICEILGDSHTEVLFLRIDILKKYQKEWLIGRSLPVTDLNILSQFNLTQKFIESLREILTENSYDSGKLVNILKENSDSRLKGFRTGKKNEIIEYFESFGYLPKESKRESYIIKSNIIKALDLNENYNKFPFIIKSDEIDFISKLFTK